MTNISFTQLHCAAAAGDIVKVKEYLAAGTHPDIRDELGRTALMLSKKLVFEIVDMLLEVGADPNACDQNGDTPLHHNSRVRDYCKYRRLVDQGADLLTVNNDGISPLEILLGYIGYLDMVKMTVGARDFTEERAAKVIKNPEHMAQLRIFGQWQTKAEKEYGRRLHLAISKSDLNAVKNIIAERSFVETLEVLRINKSLVQKIGVGWLIPFLEQYASGCPVIVDELEHAYQKIQENCGEKLKIHRTTI